jgi:hypothetical protein
MLAATSLEPAWVWSTLSVIGAAAFTALIALLAIWILHRVGARRSHISGRFRTRT